VCVRSIGCVWTRRNVIQTGSEGGSRQHHIHHSRLVNNSPPTTRMTRFCWDHIWVPRCVSSESTTQCARPGRDWRGGAGARSLPLGLGLGGAGRTPRNEEGGGRALVAPRSLSCNGVRASGAPLGLLVWVLAFTSGLMDLRDDSEDDRRCPLPLRRELMLPLRRRESGMVDESEGRWSCSDDERTRF
jgi:hypothetical protein